MNEKYDQRVYDVLDKLEISYVKHSHAPVYTVEEAEKHWGGITGAHCKNLFLRNKKGNRHYLVILESHKQADLRRLNGLLGEDRLSFASAERLNKHLGLEPGAVSPFGLINDSENNVRVVIDRDLQKAEFVNFHPNVNTATVGIAYPDFVRFLEWCGNNIQFVRI